jgi:carboxyl-terminal processing protease
MMTRSATTHGVVLREGRGPRRGCLVASGIGVLVLALVLGGGAWLVNSYGPRFGIYLVPPSPERYAEIALETMDEGYYAVGPDWAAARDDVRRTAQSATDIDELYEPLARAARVAGGKHSVFLAPQEAEQAAGDAEEGFTAPTVRTDHGITTVSIPPVGSVSEDRQTEYAETAARGIADAEPTTCGWIVDLRGNTGGDMNPMLSGVAPLLPDGPALSFATRAGEKTVVTVQADGAGIGGDTAVKIPVEEKIQDRPIAVLQDGDTGSSGEVVLTAFRGLDDVHSFGAPSAGYTSANTIHTLYDGAQLVLTGSVYVDRDGHTLAEKPVEPDTETSPADAEKAAVDWLARNGCD